jgi:hypothetical protein
MDGSDRTQLWFQFSQEIIDAGLDDSDKWAPHEFEPDLPDEEFHGEP